jgi:molecular chaperone GrpE
VSSSQPDTEFDPDRVVIRDKRRLDPETGTVKGTSGGAAAAAPPAAADDAPQAEPAEQDPRVAELTADLQRLSAEYANYRKRVDRDRLAVVEMATAGLLNELLPVLDDVQRAREHGDLTGAFAAVGERLESVATKAGLEAFGAAGDPFDPAVHEALMQAEPDPSATVAVCAQVLQPGYRLRGGRVLRPARVSVAEPAGQSAVPADAAGPAGPTDPSEPTEQ